jgi:trk system potassium uptake protein TrkA
MKSVLVIGAGQFGTHIAKRMEELRCEVMVVDIDEDCVEDIMDYVTYAKIGDGTNEEFLRTLGIDNFDVCFVTLGRHFQSSLETTSLLSELGAKKVISRATNDVQMKFLLRNGADEVVYPEKQTALRIATKYASDNILDFFHLENGIYIYELKVPRDWCGKKLGQIDVRKKYNINVLTIKRNSEVIIPSAETVIEPDDVAFVLGESENIQKSFRL